MVHRFHEFPCDYLQFGVEGEKGVRCDVNNPAFSRFHEAASKDAFS